MIHQSKTIEARDLRNSSCMLLHDPRDLRAYHYQRIEERDVRHTYRDSYRPAFFIDSPGKMDIDKMPDLESRAVEYVRIQQLRPPPQLSLWTLAISTVELRIQPYVVDLR